MIRQVNKSDTMSYLIYCVDLGDIYEINCDYRKPIEQLLIRTLCVSYFTKVHSRSFMISPIKKADNMC